MSLLPGNIALIDIARLCWWIPTWGQKFMIDFVLPTQQLNLYATLWMKIYVFNQQKSCAVSSCNTSVGTLAIPNVWLYFYKLVLMWLVLISRQLVALIRNFGTHQSRRKSGSFVFVYLVIKLWLQEAASFSQHSTLVSPNFFLSGGRHCIHKW